MAYACIVGGVAGAVGVVIYLVPALGLIALDAGVMSARLLSQSGRRRRFS